jgi:hypothetical protein
MEADNCPELAADRSVKTLEVFWLTTLPGGRFGLTAGKPVRVVKLEPGGGMNGDGGF